MTKRVLITGSAGFLGAHMVEHFLANTDWEIVGLDSFSHRGDSLRVYQDPKRYTVYHHDLNAPVSDRLMLKIGDIDYIVNAASESHVDRSIEDPSAFIKNNVNLMLNALELQMNLGAKKFVQVSTDEVYGPARQGEDHREWSTILPSNPYAASKAAQEAIAISYWRTYSLPIMICNAMNLVGERQDTEKYIPMLIKKIQSGETVTVHGQPGNIGSRKYLHCRNYADAILFLLREYHPEPYQPADRPARFNVVGDVELNNLEIAQLVAEILKKSLKFEFLDYHSARPGHDARYSLDGTKLAALGWKAPVPFHESLEKTIAWTIAHPEWMR